VDYYLPTGTMAQENKIAEKDIKAFGDITGKTFKVQAVFFLNAFWPELSTDGKEGKDIKPSAKFPTAEKVWKAWEQFVSTDRLQYGALPENNKRRLNEWSEGNDLDEFWSRKLLETRNSTMTAMEFKATFRAIDVNFDKKMAMTEFLLFEYKQTPAELLKRPQGTNEELVKAQAALDAVKAEIKKIEDKKETLLKKAEEGGVKGNAAKNEYEQLCSADPTDFNRALITAQAAVRKASGLAGDQPMGAVWWIQRELEEVEKYKPRKK